MQRISNDQYKANPTYESSSRAQTYQPSPNPPRQNTNSEKPHIPFHLFSIPNSNTRSETQFRSPSPLISQREQNYRQESVSPQNKSKMSAYYSKNSPKKTQVGRQQHQHQPIYTKQPSNQFQQYQNEYPAKISSPIYIGQDKNQRPQAPFTRNIPASDSHRRINSLFNNYTPAPQQRERSPLNFITDMYHQDFQNKKYLPPSIYDQPYQPRETSNPAQNRIQFRYSPPKETAQQVYPQYNYVQNTYSNPASVRTAEITKQNSPKNFQTNTDFNERPRCETYYNGSSISKQSSPRASEGRNFYANKDPYDSERVNGEWNFFKAIANTKPTSVRVPDYKSSEKVETSRPGGIGDFIKSLTSSKPVSPKNTEAKQFIQNLQYKGDKRGEQNRKMISTDQVIKEQKKIVNTTDIYRISSDESKKNKNQNQTSSFQKSSISSQFSRSELSPEAEQKIKLLSEHVNELRDKLRNFHKNYGKIIKDYEQKDRKSRDGSFLNSQAYSQQIRKLEQQFQNKLMENVKELEQKIAAKTASQEQLQKDLKLQEDKMLQLTHQKQKLMKEIDKIIENQSTFKMLNNQLNQSNEQLRKQISQLQNAIHQKQSDSKLKDELIVSTKQQVNQKNVKIQQLQQRIQELQGFNEQENQEENKYDLKSTNESALKKIEEIEREYREALQQSQEQVQSLQAYTSTLENDIKNHLNNFLMIVKSMHPQKITEKGKLSTVTEEEEIDEDLEDNWVIIMQKITKQLEKLHGEMSKKDSELSKINKQLSKYRKCELLDGYYGSTPKKEPSLRRASTEIKDKDNSEKIKYLEESLEILQMQFSQELQSMRTTVSQKKQIEKENKALSKRVKELQDMIQSPEKTGTEWDYSSKEVGSFFSVFNGSKTNKITSKKRSGRNITWAIESMNVSEELEEENEQVKQFEQIKQELEHKMVITEQTKKKQIKSLKQIEEMLSEAVICTSENIIADQISVPKNVLVYICDILEIPTSRKQYMQSLSHIDQNQQSQVNPDKIDPNQDKKGQSVLSTAESGQALLENIINYLQNNCTAFVTQKLYREILQFFEKELQQMKKYEEEEQTKSISPLLLSHKYLLRVLYKEKNKSKKIRELEEELEVACDQLQDEKEDHGKQRLENERLESICSKLEEKNEEVQKIISEQNEQIVRYHLQLQNLKLSSIKTEDEKQL